MAKTEMFKSATRLTIVVLVSVVAALFWGRASADAQTTFNEYQQAVLADSPSMYLTFDEDESDVAGNNIPSAIVTNTTTLSATGTAFDVETPLSSGKSLAAFTTEFFTFSFPEVLQISNSPASLAAIQTPDTTIEGLWRQDDGNPFGSSTTIFQTSSLSTVDSGIRVLNAQGQLRVVGFDTAGQFEIAGAAPVEPGTWYHIAITHEQTREPRPPNGDLFVTGGKVNLYQNGELVGSADTDGSILYDDTNDPVLSALSGIDADGSYEVEPHYLDELAVYPRALTQAEIQAHVAQINETTPNDDFVYVAFGDSFASGEGSDRFSSFATSNYENGANYPEASIQENTLTSFFGSGNACHRSLVNYAKLNIGQFEPALDSILVDRTCSGAELVQGSQPAIILGDGSQLEQSLDRLQLRGIDPSAVDLVTVSMGGNDMGFSKLIEACIASSYARNAVDQLGGDGFIGSEISSAIQAKWVNCESIDPVIADTAQGLADLRTELPGGHAAIAEAFPNAQVLHVNYPVFLPERQNFPTAKCSLIDARDAEYARSIAAELNGVIADAVANTNTAFDNRFGIVDVSDSFGTNPLCPADPANQLINAVPDGALNRIATRISDPTQEPGIWLEFAKQRSTLGACAFSWVPDDVAEVDCYSDEAIDNFLAWFQDENAINIITSNLASVDPGVPADDIDGARFENFRGLFHPNAAGFELYACEVLGTYRGTGSCAPVGRQLVEPKVNGAPATTSSPIEVIRDAIITFEIADWSPAAPINIRFLSDPIDLGDFEADPDGILRVSITVPSDAVSGVHRIVFSGEGANGEEQRFEQLVELDGVVEPGQLLGTVFTLEPLEVAEVNYLNTDIGRVQADEFGNAFLEVLVPDYAAVDQVQIQLSRKDGSVLTTSVVATAVCGNLEATIVGTPKDDVIVGTEGIDVIAALGGNDTIAGLGGDDIICGGAGDDEISGGNGNDQLFGAEGDDRLTGDSGLDVANGGQGLNICSAEQVENCQQNSAPEAVDDEETVMVETVSEFDVVANDVDIDGNLDEASLRIVSPPTLGEAEVISSEGDTIVLYTPGSVPGQDSFSYEICDTAGECSQAIVTVDLLSEGACTIRGTEGDDLLIGTDGADIICGLGGDDELRGLGGDDTLLGGLGRDWIDGGNGADVILGGRGADVISGGRGADTIRGGRGADVIDGGEGSDRISGGRGPDEIRGGNGNDFVKGRSGNDIIVAGRGNDLVRGGRGSDQIDGSSGVDVAYGGPGSDSCRRVEYARSCRGDREDH